MGKRVNKRELAEIFGVSERSFTEYQKDTSFPIAKAGGRGQSNEYDTQDVHEWLMARAVNGARSVTYRERYELITRCRVELASSSVIPDNVTAVHGTALVEHGE